MSTKKQLKLKIQENLDDIEYLQSSLIKSIKEKIEKTPDKKVELIELEEELLQEFYHQHFFFTLKKEMHSFGGNINLEKRPFYDLSETEY